MSMKQTGLTLIELMVTLVVISTLLALAAPQFQATTANSRLTSGINALTSDFSFARTEAIKRGESVSIEAANADWATGGWKVETADKTSLRVSAALAADVTFATTNPANLTSVTFTSDGRSSTSVTFTLCDNRSGTFGKQVDLVATGQFFLTTKIQCN